MAGLAATVKSCTAESLHSPRAEMGGWRDICALESGSGPLDSDAPFTSNTDYIHLLS